MLTHSCLATDRCRRAPGPPLLSAVLLLGNVAFARAGDGDDDFAAVAPGESARAAKDVAHLLGLAERKVAFALTKRMFSSGHGSTAEVPLSCRQARDATDALAKAIYSGLFSWLVARVNASITAKGAGADGAAGKSKYRHVGILDIFGFEILRHNSFEQLCINFANEKLQQFFLTTVFDNEANQYKEEGVPWTPIEYADNKDIISLCEAQTTGSVDESPTRAPCCC